MVMSSLGQAPLSNVLAELYSRARAAGRPHGLHKLPPTATAQERADAASDAFMPISPASGRLLYSLLRAAKPATVVEFGMSYGISTLHLAAAVRDNGAGRIFTTELSTKKVAAGSQTSLPPASMTSSRSSTATPCRPLARSTARSVWSCSTVGRKCICPCCS